jgi:hypothetical protein
MAAVGLDLRAIYDRCERNQPFCGPPSKADPRVRSSPRRDVGGDKRAPSGCNPSRGADPAGAAPPPGPDAPPGGRGPRWVGRGRLAAEGSSVRRLSIRRAAQRQVVCLRSACRRHEEFIRSWPTSLLNQRSAKWFQRLARKAEVSLESRIAQADALGGYPGAPLLRRARTLKGRRAELTGSAGGKQAGSRPAGRHAGSNHPQPRRNRKYEGRYGLNRNAPSSMVAGAGFEPATFG